MSFGYYNNNNKVAVSNGNTVDSSFNKTYPNSTNTTGFKLNGVDICNYITEYAPGFQTDNNYGFSVNGININQKFSFNKPVLGIAGGTASTDANYRYYKFTGSGSNLTITIPNFQALKNELNTNPIGIQMLLVGGGGSGANTSVDNDLRFPGAGGGGAGSFVTISFSLTAVMFNNNSIIFTPTIGGGGTIAATNSGGNPGGVSSLQIASNTSYTIDAGGGEGGFPFKNRSQAARDARVRTNPSGSAGGVTPATAEANTYQYSDLYSVGHTITPASSIFTIESFRKNGGLSFTSNEYGVEDWFFASYGGGGGGGAGGDGGGGGWLNGGGGGAGKQWINGVTYAGGGGGTDNSAVGGTVGGGGTGGGCAGNVSGTPNT
jgi:hypothetical protein